MKSEAHIVFPMDGYLQPCCFLLITMQMIVLEIPALKSRNQFKMIACFLSIVFLDVHLF